MGLSEAAECWTEAKEVFRCFCFFSARRAEWRGDNSCAVLEVVEV